MEKINCYLCGSNIHNDIVLTWKNLETDEQFKIVNCICNFKFLSPRPTSLEIEKYYQTLDYHPHSKGKGIIHYLFNLSRKITYKWKLKIIKNEWIGTINHLDYGSGDESFVKYLIKKGINSSSYDKFYTDSKNNIIKGKKFNIITLWHSLEHIHDLDKLFLDLDTLLEEKGKIIFAVPNFDAPERRYFNNNWKAYDLPRHIYHFDSYSLDKLLEIKGFKVINRKRMILDTIYISLLSKSKDFGYIKLFYIIIQSIFKVISKGPRFSSSLLYVCEKNN